MASIFNLLGLNSPSHVLGKYMHRENCDEKIPWKKVPQNLRSKFEKWVSGIFRTKLETPRPVPLKKEALTTIYLYDCGYRSIVASCAVVYAVVQQPKVTNRGLVINK